MADFEWETEHSVKAAVPLSFAWRYWTDVSLWADPPAEFSLEGPFESGSQGITRAPGQPDVHWVIRDVQPGESATIEIPMGQAVFRFQWRFRAISEGRTQITQRILFSGSDNPQFEQARTMFAANLPAGMRKTAESMEQAKRGSATASEA